jgi:hypothetical protein
MRIQPSIYRWCCILVSLTAAACADGPVAPGYQPEPRLLTAEYECTVDVRAGNTTCHEVRDGGGASANVILSPPFVSFVTNSAYSRGDNTNEDTITYTIAIRNATPQPLGTTDGINLAPGGIRLFFATAPVVKTVSSGTIAGSSIRLETPDGTATFTNQTGTTTYLNRMYFQYDEVLAPGDTSVARSMRFIYSSNVQAFEFSYRVSAPAQYEHGWITIAPATAPVLAPGQTMTLTGTVYNQVGQVQANGITWSSSDPYVTTVNASTGEVTAVGEGTATITATSTVNTQRTGTRVVTVDAVPGVASTTPANGEVGVAPWADIVIEFSEPVNVSGTTFSIVCTTGAQFFSVSGSGTSTINLTPANTLPALDTCTVTVVAAGVSDVDAADGPDHLAENYVFSFEPTFGGAP